MGTLPLFHVPFEYVFTNSKGEAVYLNETLFTALSEEAFRQRVPLRSLIEEILREYLEVTSKTIKEYKKNHKD